MLKEAFTIENECITSIKPKYVFEYDADWLNYANSSRDNRTVFAASDYDEVLKTYTKSIEEEQFNRVLC